jgi:hypothetical protein
MNTSITNKYNMKSKDKKFRITKKSAIERATELEHLRPGISLMSPIIITGLNQNPIPQINGKTTLNISKSSNQTAARSRTTPKNN